MKSPLVMAYAGFCAVVVGVVVYASYVGMTLPQLLFYGGKQHAGFEHK